MAKPQLWSWPTVLTWTAGVIVFIILMTTFWGDGLIVFTPAVALVALRIRLILEPRWDLDAELKAILGRG